MTDTKNEAPEEIWAYLGRVHTRRPVAYAHFFQPVKYVRADLLADMTRQRDALSAVLWMAEEWYRHGGDETTEAVKHRADLDVAINATAEGGQAMTDKSIEYYLRQMIGCMIIDVRKVDDPKGLPGHDVHVFEFIDSKGVARELFLDADCYCKLAFQFHLKGAISKKDDV